jgi:hypothetical protein
VTWVRQENPGPKNKDESTNSGNSGGFFISTDPKLVVNSALMLSVQKLFLEGCDAASVENLSLFFNKVHRNLRGLEIRRLKRGTKTMTNFPKMSSK